MLYSSCTAQLVLMLCPCVLCICTGVAMLLLCVRCTQAVWPVGSHCDHFCCITTDACHVALHSYQQDAMTGLSSSCNAHWCECFKQCTFSATTPGRSAVSPCGRCKPPLGIALHHCMTTTPLYVRRCQTHSFQDPQCWDGEGPRGGLGGCHDGHPKCFPHGSLLDLGLNAH